MSYITFYIAILCTNPSIYEKFKTEGSNTGNMVMRCEAHVLKCLDASPNLKLCSDEVKGMR